MSFTLTTSLAIIRKAGLGANTTIVASGAAIQNWCDQAESEFCGLTRKDWITDYASIATNLKPMIEDAVSGFAAIKVIQYDMSGYTSRTEAQTLLDVLTDNNMKIVNQLKDKENQGFRS